MSVIPHPQVDPRFDNAVNMIRKGVFGWEGYFEELLQTLSGSRDYYLVANDFPAYLLAQVHVVSSFFEIYQRVMTTSYMCCVSWCTLPCDNLIANDLPACLLAHTGNKRLAYGDSEPGGYAEPVIILVG